MIRRKPSVSQSVDKSCSICQRCRFTPFGQQTGLSVRGPGTSPGWRKYRRICEPSDSASDPQGLSSLEWAAYTQTHACVNFRQQGRFGPSSGKTEAEWPLTFTLVLRFDQVEHLAQQILEGQRFDAHSFHPLTLLLIEILQLKHGQDAVTIRVHAAKPVLYAGGERDGEIKRVTAGGEGAARPHGTQQLCITWWDFSCLPLKGGTRRTQRSSSCLLSAQRFPWKHQRQSCSHSPLPLWWGHQLLCLFMSVFPLTE